MEFLAQHSVLAKNMSLQSGRGRKFNYLLYPVIPSYSTDIGKMDHGRFVDLLTDVALAVRLYKTGSMEPVLGEYRYVTDFSEMIAKIKFRLNANPQHPLAIDLETKGSDFVNPKAWVICVQLTCEAGKSDVLYMGSQEEEQRVFKQVIKAQLEWLLNNPQIKVRGANLKYDLPWLKKRFALECTNFVFDTTLVGSLLDENRSNSLDVHTKIYVPALGGYADEFNRTVDKSRMDLVPKDKMLLYAGGDTDADFQVGEEQKKQLFADPQLTSFYVNILHPAARAFEDIEYGGVLVSKERMRELDSKLTVEIHDLIARAKKIIGGSLVAKHLDTTKLGNLNITKASLIKDFMFSPRGLNLKPKMETDGGDTSTAMAHLEMFSDNPEAAPFVELLGEYSSATKTKNTYVDGFLEHLRADGRFHPTYFLFAGNKRDDEGGTNTGRLSAKNPAFQCLTADTPVLTKNGYNAIVNIVSGFECGQSFTVLTHTGKWRDVIGVYRNGIQPVFNVKFESGKVVQSTANHPYLTNKGWVQTGLLMPGDVCYELRTPNEELHQPNVLLMDSHEEQMLEYDEQRLAPVRWAWNSSRPSMAQIRDVFRRHGGKAGQRLVDRKIGREWSLYKDQLCLGNSEAANEKPNQYKDADLQRFYENRGRVGYLSGHKSGTITLPPVDWSSDGGSLEENEAQDGNRFKEVKVVSITPAGERETFDLTIDKSHSFVANGIVVHNTIPKHTKWAKLIRACYVAPPGYVVMERDYSQGELRVVACVANEPTMIAAYRAGRDMHVETAGPFRGYTYDQMMALKKIEKELYDSIRQLGKAGNFGLLYGMGVDGFMIYARKNYGVSLSYEQAETFWTSFFTKYKMLTVYHDTYKAYARKYGMVRGPLGRVRHLPLINSPYQQERALAERQAINSPIQGCLSDMLIWTLALERTQGLSKVSPAFGSIHDAAYNYVPENLVDKLIPAHLDIMENLPFDLVNWNPQLKFLADAKFGPDMAHLTEFKRAA